MTTKKAITKQKHERYARSLNGLKKKPGRYEVSTLLSSLNKEAAEELRGIAGNLEMILAAPTAENVSTLASDVIARIRRMLPQRTVADFPKQSMCSLIGRYCEVEASGFLGIIMNVFPEGDIVQYLMTGPSPHMACAPMSKVHPLMDAERPWPRSGQTTENLLPVPELPLPIPEDVEDETAALASEELDQTEEDGKLAKLYSEPAQVVDTISKPARTYTQINEEEFKNLPNQTIAVAFASAGQPVEVTKVRKGRWVFDEEGTHVGNEEAWVHLNDHAMDGIVYRVDVETDAGQ